jgi:hypothetical protein
LPGGDLLMYQNYFVVNDVKYYTGSVFIYNEGLKEEEMSFICYDTAKDIYIYKRKECICNTPSKLFWKQFVATTNKVNKNVHMPMEKVLKDRYIADLPLGWAWYIFLMMVATIFKGAIVLWILISYVFFNWRSKKIKKEGTYIEW